MYAHVPEQRGGVSQGSTALAESDADNVGGEGGGSGGSMSVAVARAAWEAGTAGKSAGVDAHARTPHAGLVSPHTPAVFAI